MKNEYVKLQIFHLVSNRRKILIFIGTVICFDTQKFQYAIIPSDGAS